MTAETEIDRANVGRRLYVLRTARGWTQRRAAEECGIHGSASAWRRYETGNNLPSAQVLIHISRAFGTSVDWILLGRHYVPTSI